MNKQEFIEQLIISDNIDPDYVDTILELCIKRLLDKINFPDSEERCEISLNVCLKQTSDEIKEQVKLPNFERCCKLSMAIMEETGELIQAMSQRMRGRTNDNYAILEESADVILNVLCTCKLFGISMNDLQKAIMVKCKHQEKKTDWNQ